MHAKVFSIQIFQYTIRQIPPRVCTLVLFIYIANVTERTFEIVKKKSRSREYHYLIISIIKNVERASTARVRESRDLHV